MPRTSPAKRMSEGADDYPHVVIRWEYPCGRATRIIQCRQNIQWIIQHLIGTRSGSPRWRSVSFTRTRNALLRLLPGKADELISLLPDRFPDPALTAPEVAV